jgi:alcohol dehydrogenase class IV
MVINIRALRERQPDSEAMERYVEVAQILTGNPHASAVDGADWVEGLCSQLEVVPLGAYGVTDADFPELIEKASRSSSMKGNPVKLLPAEVEEILARAV